MNIFHFCHICLLCHQKTNNPYDLCINCEENLPYRTTEKYLALCDYAFPVDHMITQLKFHEQLIYAKLLGQLLTKKIIQHYKNTSLPTLIIPVPLHRKRLQERGFNQALEIAKPISHLLDIPINKHSCIRHLYTSAQSSLNATDRKKNIKNCFKIVQPIRAQHIAILDDVITTGETIHELAETVKKQGVEKIELWCCAHTT